MDDSGSIRDKNPADGSYDNYQLLKDFIKKLLQRLDIGPDSTRVSIIRYTCESCQGPVHHIPPVTLLSQQCETGVAVHKTEAEFHLYSYLVY